MSLMTDRNIDAQQKIPLVSPAQVKAECPIHESFHTQIAQQRKTVEQILDGSDERMIAIVGPCSIHDINGAIVYAQKLADVAHEVSDKLFVIMRAYFAKPRTTIGWKGLFYDPELKMHGEDINAGARYVRHIAVEIAQLGVPIGTEVLDPYMIQYIDDLTTWACIGARTVESQLHRELASGLSVPVGLKNSTDGRTKSVIDAIEAANHPHHFWGMDEHGHVCLIPSRGNAYAHVVLRGSDQGPNYDHASASDLLAALNQRSLRQSLIIDCSHGNSTKQPQKQAQVLRDVLAQRTDGNTHIVGFMLESNLVDGRQDLQPGKKGELTFGQSITDACIGFDETADLLREAASRL